MMNKRFITPKRTLQKKPKSYFGRISKTLLPSESSKKQRNAKYLVKQTLKHAQEN